MNNRENPTLLIAALIIVLMNTLFIGQATAADECISALEISNRAEKESDSDAREELYKEAIAACPSLSEIHFNYGLFLESQGRTHDALELYKQAVEINQRPLYFVAIGRLNAAQGDTLDAVRAYEQALELDPKDTGAMLGLAAARAKIGDLQSASDLIDQASLGSKGNVTLLYSKGLILEEQGQLDQALEVYKKVLEADPTFYQAQKRKGAILKTQGEFEGAVNAFREALKLEPSDSEINSFLGLTYEKIGNLVGAEQEFRKAAELEPTNAKAQYNLGVILNKSKKSDLAELVLKKAATLEPKNVDTLTALGWTQTENQNFEEAESTLRRAILLDPSNAKALNNLGVLLQRVGRESDAQRYFRNAVRLNPSLKSAQKNLETSISNTEPKQSKD